MQQLQKVKLKSPLSSAAKEAVAALRAEVQIELQNKKQCAYQPYECSQLTLDGYNYCSRHILEDKNAPFRQCSFVYTSNGKRCHLPAPKGDKKEYARKCCYPRKFNSRYCNEHALKSTLQKNRNSSRYPPPSTAEVLLNSLTHYVKKPRTRTTSSSTQHSEDDRITPDEGAEAKATKSLDPFTDLDAQVLYNTTCHEVLDMCSESESDVEASTYASVWHNAQADSSDNESIDSDQEDILKHANVYTAEEITLITRDKLIRLQSLYIDQYRHLQHLLREKRRKYLHALKKEKENCCSISSQVRDNPKEQRLYKKLKAYNQYHKKHGVDAILSKRMHDLRLKITEGMTPKPHTYSKCAFSEGGVKCGERALPVARHCRKHILEDPNQVLFRPCGKMCADIECTTPVEAIFDDATCRLHSDIPPIRSYNQTRKDSESDYDDSMELNAPSTSGVQVETPVEEIKVEAVVHSLPTFEPKVENISSMFDANITAKPLVKEGKNNHNFTLTKTENTVMTENKSMVKEEHANVPTKIESTDVDVKDCIGEVKKEQECAIKNETDVVKQEENVKNEYENKMDASSDVNSTNETTDAGSNSLEVKNKVEEC